MEHFFKKSEYEHLCILFTSMKPQAKLAKISATEFNVTVNTTSCVLGLFFKGWFHTVAMLLCIIEPRFKSSSILPTNKIFKV